MTMITTMTTTITIMCYLKVSIVKSEETKVRQEDLSKLLYEVQLLRTQQDNMECQMQDMKQWVSVFGVRVCLCVPWSNKVMLNYQDNGLCAKNVTYYIDNILFMNTMCEREVFDSSKCPHNSENCSQNGNLKSFKKKKCIDQTGLPAFSLFLLSQPKWRRQRQLILNQALLTGSVGEWNIFCPDYAVYSAPEKSPSPTQPPLLFWQWKL